jgi:hypothetical protein
MLSLNPDNLGYPRVMLSDLRTGRYGKKTRIHRLVMLAFHGAAPPDRQEVNHIDGNRANNNLHNLEYVSRAGNLKHAAVSLGRWKYSIEERRRISERLSGARNYQARLTEADAALIYNLYHSSSKPKGLQKALAWLFDVPTTCISRLVTGKTYKY